MTSSSTGLAAILLMGLLASPVASYTDIESARRAYEWMPFNDLYVDKDQRNKMANAIHDYWADFHSRRPRLSSSETEWLTAEMDPTDMVRIDRVTQTREFHLWDLGNFADQCTDSVSGLLMALDTSEQRTTDMFHWTQVANCYH